MKKILLSLSLLFSPIFLAEDGPFTVFYGFQTEDPLEIVAATDQLWEDCDKGDVVVSLNADAINGESTNTHTYVVNYPNNAASGSSLGPFTVSSSTSKVDTRARARAIALKIANTSTNQSWKLGTFRLDIQPDGRR